METLISPSLLSANFLNLQKDIEMINQSEADWLHLDIMDGVFVPNISFGFPVIEAVQKICKKPLDVHLMIVQPERYIEQVDVIDVVDMVLLMSVNPGFGGQQFIPHTVEKVKRLKQLIETAHTSTLIQVDGGVDANTAPALVQAGADVLVSGSYIFRSRSPLETISALKHVRNM